MGLIPRSLLRLRKQYMRLCPFLFFMFDLRRASHKVYVIKYHLVLVVKYGQDLFLDDSYVDYLKVILRELDKRYYLCSETVGFDEDHVHILMQAAPRYSPCRIFQIVKSITVREMFGQFPEIKKDLWGGEFWTDSGYVGTVGEGGNADVIRKYIQNQGRKGDQLRILDFIPEA